MSMDAASAMRARLRADLQIAMQARDAAETSVLRALIAAIDNAQAVAVDLSGPASSTRAFGDGSGETARRALDTPALQALLRQEADARRAAAEVMAGHKRDEDAARLRAEAAIVMRYVAN